MALGARGKTGPSSLKKTNPEGGKGKTLGVIGTVQLQKYVKGRKRRHGI